MNRTFFTPKQNFNSFPEPPIDIDEKIMGGETKMSD
jgi:hypothetical protein